jgi:poly(3-hydroxybutyrate) depolymerase
VGGVIKDLARRSESGRLLSAANSLVWIHRWTISRGVRVVRPHIGCVRPPVALPIENSIYDLDAEKQLLASQFIVAQMITRRDAVRLLGSASAGAWFAATRIGLNLSMQRNTFAARLVSAPPLAPGAPTSPERLALIEAFEKRSEGLQAKFEARTHKSDWVMPYRLFRPATARKVPLVVYLHGSGGLGDDNVKQLTFGNRFGTRVWLLPENQKRFPCYVVAPQTDRGWIRYDFSKQPALELAGFGDGSRLTLEIVDALCREFAIDEHRIYIAGNSMGGAGVWNVLANRSNFFAAAVITCAGVSPDDGTGSVATPLWDFHGESDEVVPVSSARGRIAARRNAGGHPLYTEYHGADHDGVARLAFTEPALPKWVFSQHRANASRS